MFGAAVICLVLASLFAFILRRQGGEQNQLEGRVPVDEQHQDGEEGQGGDDDSIRKSVFTGHIYIYIYIWSYYIPDVDSNLTL